MSTPATSSLTAHATSPSSPPPPRQFASDNRAGLCPEALQALIAANAGHAASYGDDASSHRAVELFRELFETDCGVYFVPTGTAANSLALAHLCQSYHAVVAHYASHIATDECNAPAFFGNGLHMRTLDTPTGKLTPADVRTLALARTDVHAPKAGALSLTQATELGTVYTPAELAALCVEARIHNLRVHVDGARFANALAALNCSPAELSWKAGVDVLCFGGTKNGMSAGETVLFFDKKLGHDFEYRRKQAGHLLSKMRYVTAQWVGVLEDGAYLRHAAHANAMAQQLAAAVQAAGCEILYPVEANAVFTRISPAVQAGLRAKGWAFYTYFPPEGVRLMCSWDTTPDDLARLTRELREVIANPPQVTGEVRSR
jgi:threonine aldolase